MTPPVAVKICGVADAASAALAAELGAGFLGLNFWPGSPRCVDAARARQIAAAARAVSPRIVVVGVFVHPTAAQLAAAQAAADLDLLQFSGDEPAAEVAPHAGRAIKALRSPTAVPPGFASCWGVLFDAPAIGGGAPVYGGSGRAWDYGRLAAVLAGEAGRRVFLAGGLGPHNVRQAVATLRPYAVDVCSRVESAPGKKDPQLLRQLFEEISNGQAASAT
jgi:phosphoribosylanthranilate isomerase